MLDDNVRDIIITDDTNQRVALVNDSGVFKVPVTDVDSEAQLVSIDVEISNFRVENDTNLQAINTTLNAPLTVIVSPPVITPKYESATDTVISLASSTLASFGVVTNGTIATLKGVLVYSSVNFQVTIQSWDGVLATDLFTIGNSYSGGSETISLPEDFITLVGDGTNEFRASVTNLDQLNSSSSIFVTLFWVEA